MLPHLLERTDNMKKIRSYTSIWSVEKVLYSINDFNVAIPHHVHTDGVVRGICVCSYALGEPPSPFVH